MAQGLEIFHIQEIRLDAVGINLADSCWMCVMHSERIQGINRMNQANIILPGMDSRFFWEFLWLLYDPPFLLTFLFKRRGGGEFSAFFPTHRSALDLVSGKSIKHPLPKN